MLQTKRQSNKVRLWLIIAGALVLIAGGLAVYLFWTNSQQKPNDQAYSELTPPMQEVTSEGVTYKVPDELADDSIKNYGLVVETEEYKIRYDQPSQSYVVTLYAIINNPSQYEDYKQQLREYKQKALDLLKSKGLDTNKISIIYEPS